MDNRENNEKKVSETTEKEVVIKTEKSSETSPNQQSTNNFDGKKILPLVAIVALVLFILYGVSNRQTTIDLNDYTVMRFDGGDGYGTVTFDVDRQKLLADHGEALRDNLNDSEFNTRYTQFNQQDAVDGLLTSAIQDYTLTPQENLKNGDKVKLTWDINDEQANEIFNVKLKAEDQEFTVEGLKEMTTKDPFEKVEFRFEGFSGKGTFNYNNQNEAPLNYLSFSAENDGELKNNDTVMVRVENYQPNDFVNDGIILEPTEKEVTVEGLKEMTTKDPFEKIDFSFEGISGEGTFKYNNQNEAPFNHLTFSAENDGELSNGDKVMISVDNYQTDDFVDDGIILEPIEKEVTVTGLTEIVTQLDQIDDQMVEDLHSEVSDYVTSYAAKSWNSDVHLVSTEYAGHYLMTPKDPQQTPKNAVTIVTKYTAQVDNQKYGVKETVVGYYPITYFNFYINEDGKIAADDLSERDTAGTSFKKEFKRTDKKDGTWTLNFLGYESMNDLKSSYINKNLDEWNIQESVPEEKDNESDQ